MLAVRFPADGTGVSVCRVVDRFGSSSVPGANIRSSRDDSARESSSVRCGNDVQRRVAGIDVVMDRGKEVRLGILAGRSDANWSGGEGGNFVKQSDDLPVITCTDGSEECQQYRVVGVVGVVEPST